MPGASLRLPDFVPCPGAAVTQALADQSSIQVVVHTNINASTSMVAVDAVASWAQLVTAINAAPSANITLSPTFQMGAYYNEIDFRLVIFIQSYEIETVPYILSCLLVCCVLSIYVPVCLSIWLSVSPTQWQSDHHLRQQRDL